MTALRPLRVLRRGQEEWVRWHDVEFVLSLHLIDNAPKVDGGYRAVKRALEELQARKAMGTKQERVARTFLGFRRKSPEAAA